MRPELGRFQIACGFTHLASRSVVLMQSSCCSLSWRFVGLTTGRADVKPFGDGITNQLARGAPAGFRHFGNRRPEFWLQPERHGMHFMMFFGHREGFR
jgi:hypothetical protein